MWLEMNSKVPCLPSFKSFSYYCVTVDIHCAANCAAPLAVVRMSRIMCWRHSRPQAYF